MENGWERSQPFWKSMPLPGVFRLRSSGSYWKIWAQLILSWVRSCLFVPIFCRNATVTSWWSSAQRYRRCLFPRWSRYWKSPWAVRGRQNFSILSRNLWEQHRLPRCIGPRWKQVKRLWSRFSEKESMRPWPGISAWCIKQCAWCRRWVLRAWWIWTWF